MTVEKGRPGSLRRFAESKRDVRLRRLRLRRLRLRGLPRAAERFLLAATAQNRKRLAAAQPWG